MHDFNQMAGEDEAVALAIDGYLQAVEGQCLRRQQAMVMVDLARACTWLAVGVRDRYRAGALGEQGWA